DKQVKAVVVATPNSTHYSLAKTALQSGKHVLSEKPLALKTVECEELKKLAEGKGLVLLVEYTYTFSQALAQAQDIINSGKIGQVLGIEMSVKHLGRFGGGSVYWLLGSHMLSVLDMFVPLDTLEFMRNDIVSYRGEVETGVIAFKNGNLSGQIFISLNYTGKETKIILYGEKGTIIYNPIEQPSLQVETYKRLRWTIASELPRQYREYHIDESNNLAFAVEHFYHDIERMAKGNVIRAVSITKILEELQSD
ncbi:Gfo/Idh/MocA family protein, partial [Chloroflexota bacterium]